MNISQLSYTFLFIFALLTLGTSSKNVYVSQNGSDINGDGTEQKPFESLQKALNELKKLNGETIFITGNIKGTCIIPMNIKSVEIVGKPSGSLSCSLMKINNQSDRLSLALRNLTFASNNVMKIDAPILNFEIDNCLFKYVNTGVIEEPFFFVSDEDASLGVIKFINSQFIVRELNWKNNIPVITLDTESLMTFRNITMDIDVTEDHSIEIISSDLRIFESHILSDTNLIFHNHIRFHSTSTHFLSSTMLIHSNKIVVTNNIFMKARVHSDDPEFISIRLIESKEKLLAEEYQCEINNNEFIYGGLLLYIDKSLGGYIPSIMHNTFYNVDDEKHSIRVLPEPPTYIPKHSVNASFNYYGDSSGPTICCNKEGTGLNVSLHVDYSYWCLDDECKKFSLSKADNHCLQHGCHLTLSRSSIIIMSVFAGTTFALSMVLIIYYNIIKKKDSNINEYQRLGYFIRISNFSVIMSSITSIIFIITITTLKCSPYNENVCFSTIAKVSSLVSLIPMILHLVLSLFGFFFLKDKIKGEKLKLFNILGMILLALDCCTILFVGFSFFRQTTPKILIIIIASIFVTGLLKIISIVFSVRLKEYIDDPNARLAKKLVVNKNWSLQKELMNTEVDRLSKKLNLFLIINDLICAYCFGIACFDTFLIASDEKYSYQRPNPISIRHMSVSHFIVCLLIVLNTVFGHISVYKYHYASFLLVFFVNGVILVLSTFILLNVWIIAIIKEKYHFTPMIGDSLWIIWMIVVLVHTWKFRKSTRKVIVNTVMENVNRRIDGLLSEVDSSDLDYE